MSGTTNQSLRARLLSTLPHGLRERLRRVRVRDLRERLLSTLPPDLREQLRRVRGLRARLLSTLPPDLRERLRRVRDRVERWDSRVRAHLPVAWGGRFPKGALDARRLYRHDRALLLGLREPTLQPVAADEHDRPLSLDLREHALQPMAADESGRALDDPRQFCVGIFAARQLIGAGWCIALSPPPEPFRDALFAADYVRPKFRRRGVARALHAARLRELECMGACNVFAWVDPSNRAARAGLRAAGFVDVASESVSIALERPSETHQLLTLESALRARPAM